MLLRWALGMVCVGLVGAGGFRVIQEQRRIRDLRPPIFDVLDDCHTQQLLKLIANGHDVNARTSFKGLTPLHDAAATGQEHALRILLDHGAKVDAKTEDDWQGTPLASAVAHSQPGTASLLLLRGADPNARDLYGQTPLSYAVQGESLDMTRLLVCRGADVDIQDTDGKSPMDYAKERGLEWMVERALEDRRLNRCRF